MYLLVGIITMWVIRVGLFGLFVFVCFGLKEDRTHHSMRVKTDHNTWQYKTVTWAYYFKKIVPKVFYPIFIILIVVCALSWLTLLWW